MKSDPAPVIPYANPRQAAAAVEHIPFRYNPAQTLKRGARGAFWVSALMMTGGLLVGGLYWAAPLAGVVAGAVLLILIPCISVFATGAARKRGQVVLTYLDQAVRLNLPLPQMLDAAAGSESRRTALRLRRLGHSLRDGAPIDAAIWMHVPEIPGRVVSQLGHSCRVGRVQFALRRIMEQLRFQDHHESASGRFKFWYLLAFAYALATIVLTVMIYVMPKYEMIMRDFGLPLPSITVSLLNFARSLSGTTLALTILAVQLVAMLALSNALETFFLVRRRMPRLELIDALLWHLPVVGSIQRNRSLAEALHCVVEGLEAGLPLHRAVQETRTLWINAVLRNKLDAWTRLMAQGAGPAEAARQARLPEMIWGMVSDGAGPRLQVSMRFLATYYQSRFSRSAELLRAAALPVMTLAFAVLVLLVWLAMFMPILSMIDFLSGRVMKWN